MQPLPTVCLLINLEALFCPRLKASVRKLGELAALKLLAVSERRGLVS